MLVSFCFKANSPLSHANWIWDKRLLGICFASTRSVCSADSAAAASASVAASAAADYKTGIQNSTCSSVLLSKIHRKLMANYKSHDKAFGLSKKCQINFWFKSVMFSFTRLAKCKLQSHWAILVLCHQTFLSPSIKYLTSSTHSIGSSLKIERDLLWQKYDLLWKDLTGSPQQNLFWSKF